MTIALFVFAVPTLILAVILTALIEPLIHPRPARSHAMIDPVNDPLTAPWTEQQVATLNAVQRSGLIHPLTCPVMHHRLHQTLIAELDGWHCPDDACDYLGVAVPAWMADRELTRLPLAAVPPPRPPEPSLAAELRRVRAELRATQDDLSEERRRNADLAERLAELQRGNALHIHEALRRVAAVDVPCGEIIGDKPLVDAGSIDTWEDQ